MKNEATAERIRLADDLRVADPTRFAQPRLYDRTALFSKHGQPEMTLLVAWGKDAKRTSVISFRGANWKQVAEKFVEWKRRYHFRQSRRKLW